MDTRQKIKWAEKKLKPITKKDFSGKEHLFKLIPAKNETDTANSAIAVLTGVSRQHVAVAFKYKKLST